MKKYNTLHIKSLVIVVILISTFFKGSGQAVTTDVLTNYTMKEQLKYLEEHTKIFENYRAIREDMFQKIKGNISDTITEANIRIAVMNSSVKKLNQTFDSLNTVLVTTKTSLENVMQTKNSIRLFGLEISKLTYNTIMWLTVIGLSVILIIGLLVFNNKMKSTHHIQKELDELKDEFQAYRKTTREAREKMSMAHFNEIRKLKGG